MILTIRFSTSSALTGGWFIKSPPLSFQMLDGFCKNLCGALQLKLVTRGTGRREKKLRLHRRIFYFVIFAIVLLSFWSCFNNVLIEGMARKGRNDSLSGSKCLEGQIEKNSFPNSVYLTLLGVGRGATEDSIFPCGWKPINNAHAETSAYQLCCTVICVLYTTHESPIWKYFSKGLKPMAMDYYCFIPKEKRLLIQKNRAFDFTESEYVFINIYMLLRRCVVLCRLLRWRSLCPKMLTRQMTQWIMTQAKKGQRGGERGKEMTESKRKQICFMKGPLFTKHRHQVIWFPLAVILDLFFTLFYYV